MPIEHREIRVRPDAGNFQAGSFQELVQLEVHLPGLDPGWRHTLTAVAVEPDGSSATLTIHSEPHTVLSLDRTLSVVSWQPQARVRAHTEEGVELAITKLDAPLRVGQWVEVGGLRYRVSPDITWPHRHPDTGVCTPELLDEQHVVLIPDPEPPHLPRAADPTASAPGIDWVNPNGR